MKARLSREKERNGRDRPRSGGSQLRAPCESRGASAETLVSVTHKAAWAKTQASALMVKVEMLQEDTSPCQGESLHGESASPRCGATPLGALARGAWVLRAGGAPFSLPEKSGLPWSADHGEASPETATSRGGSWSSQHLPESLLVALGP